MSFSFVPPPAKPERLQTLSLLGAIVLFREATGESLGNSKYFLESNLRVAVNQEYSAREVGRLINEYFKQQPYIKEGE